MFALLREREFDVKVWYFIWRKVIREIRVKSVEELEGGILMFMW